MHPVSQRSSTPYPAGSELLRTRFGNKHIPILISMRPDSLLGTGLLPAGDKVRVAQLQNPFRVIKDLTTLLSDITPQETLVLLCNGPKVYQAAVNYLNITAHHPG